MAFVTLFKELAVAEDFEFGTGVVFQERGAGTRVSAAVIPYDDTYSIKDVLDYIFGATGDVFVSRAGDIMLGDLGIFTTKPAMYLQGAAQGALDNTDSGWLFKDYRNYTLGKVSFNETDSELKLVVNDGTGSQTPVATATLQANGLLSASNTVPVNPSDLTSKQYTDGKFPAGAWSFDGTVLDIVIAGI